jgi:hypothetical protein
MYNIVKSLIPQHSGKWFEVVTFCSAQDEGTVCAKFLSSSDALVYANRLVELSHNLYTLIIVR